jgi:hypothetical protein
MYIKFFKFYFDMASNKTVIKKRLRIRDFI